VDIGNNTISDKECQKIVWPLFVFRQKYQVLDKEISEWKKMNNYVGRSTIMYNNCTTVYKFVHNCLKAQAS
jgi:hypothetical protein